MEKEELMDLEQYFNEIKGTGVLGTADSDGNVNMAIYSRPHIIDMETIAFIMADRLSHHNLQSNGKAAYLYHEKAEKHQGIRIYMTKLKEEKNSELIKELRRRKVAEGEGEMKDRFLVYFHVDKVIPLLGSQG